MDQLVWPFLIYVVFPYLTLGAPPACTVDDCGNEYHTQLGLREIENPEPSVEYCEILIPYQKCLRANAGRCRGELSYHSQERVVKRLVEVHCPLDGKPLPKKKNEAGEASDGDGTTTASAPASSASSAWHAGCRYTGRKVFKHCGFFGDPHLKTFDSQYHTCRLPGEWYLINNPFMSVTLTNEYVDEARIATAPTKIVIVVLSRSTPCTLQQRYEANSTEGRLPSTFVDGSDRPGADETVSLKFQRNERENYETVEIRMKYVATKLVVRRVGKYLAFSAQLPEEVIRSSASYDDAGDKVELCTAGCPARELLRNVQSPRPSRPKMSREAALNACRSVGSVAADSNNNLTGSFLEWCVFDLMTAQQADDFIKVAHLAQADAHGMDPNTVEDVAETSLWRTNGEWGTQPQNDGTPARRNSVSTLVLLQLLLTIYYAAS